MPLTEAEELELLELEAEEAGYKGEARQPSGSTRSFEKPTYLEMVQEEADVLGKKSLESQQRDSSTLNKIVAPIRQFTGTMTAQMSKSLPMRAIGKGIGYLYEKTPSTPLDEPLTRAVSGVAGAANKLPEPIKNIAGIGTDILGMIPAAGGTAKVTGKPIAAATKKTGIGLKNISGRVQGTKVKINTPEFKKGASNAMYPKYGVFGSAKNVQKQWQSKIDDISNQVKSKIELSSTAMDPDNYTFVGDIFDQAKNSASKYGKSKTAIASINKQIDALKDEFMAAYPDGKINILDAQLEKQFIGKKGDWLSNAGKISGNPDAALGAQAHNALYDAFKKTIENKGSPGIRELNKQLSEMIPMERAASKQVLIQNRKNPISLDDYIGGLAVAGSAAHGNFLPLAVMGANVATKSPSVAKTLYKTGRGLEKLSDAKISTPKLKSLVGNQRGAIGGVSDDFSSNLSTDQIEKIARYSDNMGYNLTPSEKLETMGPIINDLKKKGIKSVDAYHITSGNIESIKNTGIKGSELNYIGENTGNLRDKSTYIFLDPHDVKRGQNFLKTSEIESPVVHIKIPVEELTRMNWDSNFNLSSGSYSAERFLGDIPKEWIVGINKPSQFHNIGIMTGAAGVAGGGLYLKHKTKE